MKNNYKKFLLIGALSLFQYDAVAASGWIVTGNDGLSKSKPSNYSGSWIVTGDDSLAKSKPQSVPSTWVLTEPNNLSANINERKNLNQQKIEDLRSKHLVPQTNNTSKLKR